jgi:uncharacterized protein
MRWRGREESSNVEDRRGIGRGGLAVGGGLGSLVIVVLALLFGVDPSQLLNSGQDSGQGPATQTGQQRTNPQEDELAQFVRVILRDTEKVWGDIFRQSGRQYSEPRLQLFTGQAQSACGVAGAAVGPFYCPGDTTVYLDTGFFDELTTKLGAQGGDAAEAYVFAHEFGHHIQNLTGVMQKVQSQGAGQTGPKSGGVRLELQADCYAGVWLKHATSDPDSPIQEITREDLEKAVDAAAAVGDDRIQKRMQGQVNPESWTHGSAEQRQKWLLQGFSTGDPNECNTFASGAL